MKEISECDITETFRCPSHKILDLEEKLGWVSEQR